MKTLLVIAACIFIAATALPLIHEDDWWIRIFDFPRAQIAVGALIVAAAFFCLYYDKKSLFQNVLLGTLLVSIIYQSCKMYPYTFLGIPPNFEERK